MTNTIDKSLNMYLFHIIKIIPIDTEILIQLLLQLKMYLLNKQNKKQIKQIAYCLYNLSC